jgi:tripartite-type tricarboxylate transporter receptor subunit TctC
LRIVVPACTIAATPERLIAARAGRSKLKEGAMHRSHLLRLALLAAVLLLGLTPAQAQLGEQPIRTVYPFAAGGSGDALARLVAERMHAALNRPVIVENRTGAAGRLGVQAVKAAAPDGSTLLLTPIGPMSVFQHVYPSLGYDPFADFEPVTELGKFEFGIAVAARVPVHTLKDLVAWTKANPREGNYGSPAAGSLPHFLGVMFGRAAGLDLRHVSYRGSAAVLADLVAGQIPMVVTVTVDLIEMHREGRIRTLATSDKERSTDLPEVPTFREQGFDLEATGWYGIFAPARTPPALIARYNKVLVDALATPEVKNKLLAFGMTPTGTTPAQFAAIQKADSDKWAPAVKASGFTPEQ